MELEFLLEEIFDFLSNVDRRGVETGVFERLYDLASEFSNLIFFPLERSWLALLPLFCCWSWYESLPKVFEDDT